MVPLIQDEIVDKRKWIDKEDFIDLLALTQSVPGIFAVNIAIFIGYKLRKFRGALAMALGTILPSFFIKAFGIHRTDKDGFFLVNHVSYCFFCISHCLFFLWVIVSRAKIAGKWNFCTIKKKEDMSLFTVSPFSGRRGEYTLYIVGNYVQSRRRLRNGVRRLFLKWGGRCR